MKLKKLFETQKKFNRRNVIGANEEGCETNLENRKIERNGNWNYIFFIRHNIKEGVYDKCFEVETIQQIT